MAFDLRAAASALSGSCSARLRGSRAEDLPLPENLIELGMLRIELRSLCMQRECLPDLKLDYWSFYPSFLFVLGELSTPLLSVLRVR